ncbi:MAG: methionyl-tRNA formyltransferase [Vicinamibacterales bacterium]
MRVVVAGTPSFAAAALQALAASGFDIPLVLTQPDRPAGRGLRLTASAVARAAGELRIEVAKPPGLRSAEAHALIAGARPDVLVVAAYGIILPQSILDIPPRGCFNIHASLLPRWRGAAPIQRAILAGDSRTGVCIMRMEAGLDTGPVILTRETPIAHDETAGGLTTRLARMGSEAFVEALRRLDDLEAVPQDAAHATYAAKISKAEARIDWSQDSAVIDRQVRAFNPSPGAETSIGGHGVKVWMATPVAGDGPPGKVLSTDPSAVVIGCGLGALRITELQRAGARRMRVDEFLRGNPLASGTSLVTSGA